MPLIKKPTDSLNGTPMVTRANLTPTSGSDYVNIASVTGEGILTGISFYLPGGDTYASTVYVNVIADGVQVVSALPIGTVFANTAAKHYYYDPPALTIPFKKSLIVQHVASPTLTYTNVQTIVSYILH